MIKIERAVEKLIFGSRWLLAPFFLGLIIAMLVLLVKFLKELKTLVLGLAREESVSTLVSIFTLVDTALIAGLLLIIVLSGYENFVSKLDIDEHEDRPAWMGKVGFADLKIKLMGAIVAISAVELLKGFIDMEEYTQEQLIWKVVIHLTFVISGVLFAITDRIAEGKLGYDSHRFKGTSLHTTKVLIAGPMMFDGGGHEPRLGRARIGRSQFG